MLLALFISRWGRLPDFLSWERLFISKDGHLCLPPSTSSPIRQTFAADEIEL